MVDKFDIKKDPVSFDQQGPKFYLKFFFSFMSMNIMSNDYKIQYNHIFI